MGEGIANLLGRPKLAPLDLLLREAVQNSWDARRRGSRVKLKFAIRVRNLSTSEASRFRQIVDQSDALEPRSTNALASELASRQPIRVLELADFGTFGLTGTTRPDLPLKNQPSRFINFMFDYGRSHEDSTDGGTYGFGRSSLYTASRASLILVDSRTGEGEGGTRLLIGCRVGPAFESMKFRKKGRYSGRHFWGTEVADVPQPLQDKDATKTADALGLPSRTSASQTGTTVLIPWPVSGLDDPVAIEQVLLRHLWPKMVPTDGTPTIDFSIEVDGVAHTIRDPSSADEYKLFVRALQKARTRRAGPGVEVLSTRRPIHLVGHLGVVEGLVRTRPVVAPPTVATQDDEDEPRPQASIINSVALMRSTELVVRYLPVSGTEQAGRSWAGVFISEASSPVSEAFAAAEPPAHDDWVAERIRDRTKNYIVRKTRDTLVPEGVRRALGISVAGSHGDLPDGPSLAGVSERFSEVFLSGDGQGAAVSEDRQPRSGGSGGAGTRQVRAVRVSPPELLRLDFKNGSPVAVFALRVQGPSGATVSLEATPSIFAEEGLDSLPEFITPPTVVAWRGCLVTHRGATVTLAACEHEVEIDVAFNGEYSVVLDCQAVQVEEHL